MQAIILAAGMGKRLKELTQDRTKCMVQVNGVALIDRMLHQIESRHLSRIVIVVGYEGEKLMKYIDTLGIRTPIVYVQNPIYDKTNNIYSLALAKDYLCQDDTLLFESDLIFEDAVIDQLLDDPRETLALVDKYESWMDGTCVKLGPDDSIASFVPSKNFRFEEAHEYYKTVNIYKFGRHFSRTHYVPFLEAYSKALGNNEYYEQVLRVIAMLDDPEIRAKRLNGQLWYEIDDIQDLDIASSMFAQDPDLRVSLMQGRYGGYWRYPQLLDFCYLVNPYFPPQRLIDEIQAAAGRVDGIVLNPGGYAHTSVAILDALKAVALPAVEVHLSDVKSRDDFRQVSGPSSMRHRYITEDASVGQSLFLSLAHSLGMTLPCMESLVLLAGVINGENYLRDGMTLASLGLDGLSAGEINERLHNGFPGA